MSEFEHDFSQFTSDNQNEQTVTVHTPATNESDDFEKLDPFSVQDDHNLQEVSPTGVARFTEEYINKEAQEDFLLELDQSSNERSSVSLGLETDVPHSLVDELARVRDGSEIISVGDQAVGNTEDLKSYENRLGFCGDSSKTGSYQSEVSPVTSSKSSSTDVKADVEHDYQNLKDYNPPENIAAPVVEEVYQDVSKSMHFSSPAETKVNASEESSVKQKKENQFISKMTDSEELNPATCEKKIASLVLDLVYWRDPKTSGAVFGTSLVVLLSLAYCSLISVVAYLSLALLTVTVTFRVYKNVLQAVQKSGEGHPFKEYLDMDVSLPQDKVTKAAEVLVKRTNTLISELKRLFLAEDLVDSIKFGVILWVMTYIGAWFNGLTLIILALIGAFSLPKVYENNQAQIDQFIGVANSQIKDVMDKVKAKIPAGIKAKEE